MDVIGFDFQFSILLKGLNRRRPTPHGHRSADCFVSILDVQLIQGLEVDWLWLTITGLFLLKWHSISGKLLVIFRLFLEIVN